MKLKVTAEGYAVIDGDTHLGRWIEQTGLIDHRQDLERRFHEFGLTLGHVALDIGACIGDTTIPMARVVGAEGKVFAYEPHPPSYACLVYNTRLWKNVCCYPYALGATTGIVGMRSHPNLGATHLEAKAPDWFAVCQTLDGLQLPRVDFIKLDVEGYELMVLDGGMDTIKRCRPIMWIETAGHGERYVSNCREKLFQRLKDLNYNCSPGFKTLQEDEQYDVLATPM